MRGHPFSLGSLSWRAAPTQKEPSPPRAGDAVGAPCQGRSATPHIPGVDSGSGHLRIALRTLDIELRWSEFVRRG